MGERKTTTVIVLRQTKGFVATVSPRGVRITAKERSVQPQSRVVRRDEDWDRYLAGLSDASFDGACVVDYGIGVFKRGRS
jgi:hypothetical protein